MEPTFCHITVPTSTLLHRYHLVHPLENEINSSSSLIGDLNITNALKYRSRTFNEKREIDKRRKGYI
jgi:hypothetical protein